MIRERTIEGLRRAKAQGKTLGRPKGRKDKKPRKKSGYHTRYVKPPISSMENSPVNYNF